MRAGLLLPHRPTPGGQVAGGSSSTSSSPSCAKGRAGLLGAHAPRRRVPRVVGHQEGVQPTDQQQQQPPQQQQQQQQQPYAPYYGAWDPQQQQQQVGADGQPVAQYAPPPYPYAQPRSPQEMQYMASPYYPPPPAQAYRAAEESSGAGLPWWILVGLGVLVGGVAGKVQEYMKNPKSPQQMMTEMAMKQMMGAMGPGGKPGGMPAGFPGMPPGGMPPGFPGFPGAAAGSSTVDIPPSTPGSERTGDRFNTRQRGEGASSSTSTSSKAKEEPAASISEAGKASELVEPIVREPSSSSSSSAKKSASSFFADATAEDVAKGNTNFDNTSGGGSQGSGGSEGGGATMSQMMEQMMRDPEMQKMLYPYLPEPMRNPSSIEWMLSNPEVKKQMADMFESQNMMSPQMMEMMKGMDFNQEKVNQQFQELGLKPEDVIGKVMADPELAAGFSNPKVQAAIMDISNNPMNITKYNNDPEVMKVLNKVTDVFSGQQKPR